MRLQNGRVTFRDGGRVWIYGKVRFLEISSFPFQTFRNRGLPKRESSTKQISQNFPVSINHIEYSNMIHFQRSQSNIYIYISTSGQNQCPSNFHGKFFIFEDQSYVTKRKRDLSPLNQDIRILCTCLGTHEAPKMDPS